MTLYRLIFSLVLPVIAARLFWRRLTGAETAHSLAERFGRGPTPAPARRIWLHGASNGELASARALISSLLMRRPDLDLILTANTETGRALVEGWREPRLSAALAPIDTRAALSRFLDLWQPAALIGIENEIWPERFRAATSRGIPIFILSARISGRSARNWSRVLPDVMAPVRYLSAQDAASEERFVSLGLPKDRLGPVLSLKSAANAAAGTDPLPTPRADTILAASTHEGEEEIVLDAFLAARRSRPGLRLILAPRHPRRRDEVEAAIRARDLSFRTRSRGHEPEAGLPVYLADTMGEMDRWYAGAGVTFVGGSLVDRGGHTPFEPTAHGSAILHGPFVANSAPAYGALTEAAAAVEVRDTGDLVAALIALSSRTEQTRLAAAAQEALAPFRSDTALEPFFAALDAALGPGPDPIKDS